MPLNDDIDLSNLPDKGIDLSNLPDKRRDNQIDLSNLPDKKPDTVKSRLFGGMPLVSREEQIRGRPEAMTEIEKRSKKVEETPVLPKEALSPYWYGKGMEFIADKLPEGETKKGLKFAAAVAMEEAELGSALTTPPNIMLAAAGPLSKGRVATGLVSGYFLKQQLAGDPEQWRQIKKAYADGNLEEVARLGTEMTAGHGLPLLGFKYALKGSKSPAFNPEQELGWRKELADKLKGIPPRGTPEAIKFRGQRVTDAASMKAEEPVDPDAKEPALGKIKLNLFGKTFQAGKSLVRSNFERWLGRYDGASQNADFEVREYAKDLVTAVKDVSRRRAIYNWAAAGGDESLLQQWVSEAPNKLKKEYADALTLTDHEKAVGGAVRNNFDKWFEKAHSLGMLSKALPDYLKRIVTRKAGAADDLMQGAFHSSRLTTNFMEAKKRFWQTMVDAEKVGVRYDKDIAKSATMYADSLTNSIIGREAVAQLFDTVNEKDGLPIIIHEGGGKLLPPTEPGGSPTLLVKPFGVRRFKGQAELARKLKTQNPEWSDAKSDSEAWDQMRSNYRQVDADVLRGWALAHMDEEGKTTLVKGDALVHKDWAKVIENKFGKSADVTRLDKALSFWKGSKLSLSLFHNVHEKVLAAGHLVNLSNLRSLQEYMGMPEIQSGMEHGLKLIGGKLDSAMFGEAMAAHGWPEKIPGLGKYVHSMKEHLFEDLIPRYKAQMYLNALERNRKGGPTGLRFTKQLNEEQLRKLTATQSNATFGEQNYRQMIGNLTSNPRFWRSMQRFFLAPDFGASKLQHIGQAFTKYGGEQRMAIGLTAATLYGTARVLNTIIDNDPHWDHPFSLVVGKKTYTLRSLPGDMFHLFQNPMSYVKWRLHPWVSNAMEAMTKRDNKGNVVGWSDVVKDFVTSGVPIPLTKPHGYDWSDQFATAIGLSPGLYSYESEIHKAVDKWKEGTNNPKLVSQVERHQKSVYPPSDYQDMRDALANGDLANARNEYINLIKKRGGSAKEITNINNQMTLWANSTYTGSKTLESKFYQSLNAEQRQLYLRARKDRQDVYKQFQRMRAGLLQTQASE